MQNMVGNLDRGEEYNFANKFDKTIYFSHNLLVQLQWIKVKLGLVCKRTCHDVSANFTDIVLLCF